LKKAFSVGFCIALNNGCFLRDCSFGSQKKADLRLLLRSAVRLSPLRLHAKRLYRIGLLSQQKIGEMYAFLSFLKLVLLKHFKKIYWGHRYSSAEQNDGCKLLEIAVFGFVILICPHIKKTCYEFKSFRKKAAEDGGGRQRAIALAKR
jgi:hypothetical protein